jgi:D-alanyl-D-alanine dipeptidase
MTALQAFIPQLVVDLKYASKNNFTGQVLYKCPTAFARLAVAVALKRINAELALQNLGLKIFDAYRPFSVSEKMWNIVPDERYVANPAKGSGHNRGAAVDVTLIELSTEKEVEMPTAFDDFTEKAHHDYTALSRQVQENRSKLKNIMEKYGFVSLATEWWHYSLPDAATRFELLDLDFKLLRNTLRQ